MSILQRRCLTTEAAVGQFGCSQGRKKVERGEMAKKGRDPRVKVGQGYEEPEKRSCRSWVPGGSRELGRLRTRVSDPRPRAATLASVED